MTKMICRLMLISAFSIAAIAQTAQFTIQAVNGKDGKPLSHQRLLVFGGNTAEAAKFHRTSFEATTDERGLAQVMFDPAKTLWIEVFVDYSTLCYSKVQFDVDKILSTGSASPNDCGKVTPQLKPGQFTVFARSATLREKMAW